MDFIFFENEICLSRDNSGNFIQPSHKHSIPQKWIGSIITAKGSLQKKYVEILVSLRRRG